MFNKKINPIVEEMRKIANLFPQQSDDINVLKFKEIDIFGYSLILYFNKQIYDSYFLETVQIISPDFPFLPFNLVCGIAKEFLGEENLFLMEVLKSNKKIYCWIITKDEFGDNIIYDKVKAEKRNYDGLNYFYFSTNKISI